MAHVLILFSLAALWAPARNACAQSGNEPAGYREAIAAAIEEYEASSYSEAREQFGRAHSLFPNARTLRGLGITEYELHNYPESVRYLEQALSSDVRPLDGATRSETESVLRRAKGYVGMVRLRVEPETTTVALDGQQVEGAASEPLLLSVGDHILEFRAAGRLGQRRGLTIKGGQTQTLDVKLAAEPALASTASGPASQGPQHSERDPGHSPLYKKWWLWTAVGVVAASAVVGTLYATRREIEHEQPYGTTNTPPFGAQSTRQ